MKIAEDVVMTTSNRGYLYVFLSLFALQACVHEEPFVWIESLPQKSKPTTPYRIQPGDKISVSVWDQEQISGEYTVRDDGFITVTLIGDVPVDGLTIEEAAKTVSKKFEGDIVQDVRVTVVLVKSHPIYISVIGEVRSPGQFELKPDDTMIDVLSRAGGLTEFADSDSIYVLRKGSQTPRIRFDYERLTKQKTGGIEFKLNDGDVVVVE
ncbi:MAG: hypothetical protein GY847_36525 [Proteobacteria bacterium]|nr:hypothetical protein [Pseudomonadota bacterium]